MSSNLQAQPWLFSPFHWQAVNKQPRLQEVDIDQHSVYIGGCTRLACVCVGGGLGWGDGGCLPLSKACVTIMHNHMPRQVHENFFLHVIWVISCVYVIMKWNPEHISLTWTLLLTLIWIYIIPSAGVRTKSQCSQSSSSLHSLHNEMWMCCYHGFGAK